MHGSTKLKSKQRTHSVSSPTRYSYSPASVTAATCAKCKVSLKNHETIYEALTHRVQKRPQNSSPLIETRAFAIEKSVLL